MGTYGAAQLASSFRTVRANTVQIAEDIPESKYDFVAAPGTQSVGGLLTHIAFGPMFYEDMHRHKRVTTLKGYDFAAAIGKWQAEEAKPRSKAEIIALLKSMHHRGQLMLIERMLGIVPHLTRQREERARQQAQSAA
jgi:uncharacterized damage-inducible protein DinB